MEKKIQYTVSIYTENNVGLLNRISAVFLKRHINIESFTTSECEIENVFRFIIVVEMTESGIEKVIKQIEKQVDVIRSNYNMGLITNNERYNQVIDIWTSTNAELTELSMKRIREDQQGFNSVYMMLDSGARGSKEQIIRCFGQLFDLFLSTTQKQ